MDTEKQTMDAFAVRDLVRKHMTDYMHENMEFFLKVCDGNHGAVMAGIVSSLIDSTAYLYAMRTSGENDASYVQNTMDYLALRIESYRGKPEKDE